MIFSSRGGTRFLFNSSSNWSHLYFTDMLKGLVKLEYIQLSMGPFFQVSPPRPGISSTLPRFSLLLQLVSSSTIHKYDKTTRIYSLRFIGFGLFHFSFFILHFSFT